MRIEDTVRRFILDELGWNGEEALTDEYQLLGTGVLDSIGVVHVMSFLEGEYGLHLFDQEVDFHNFGSIENIARLVESSVSAQGTRVLPAGGRTEVEAPEEEFE